MSWCPCTTPATQLHHQLFKIGELQDGSLVTETEFLYIHTTTTLSSPAMLYHKAQWVEVVLIFSFILL